MTANENVWKQGSEARGPALWRAPDLEDDSGKWILQMTDADVQEVKLAFARTKASGIRSINDMSDDPAEFPLHDVGHKLADVAAELEDGRGFSVLRGLPVEEFDVDDAAIILRGIATHLGVCVSQNYRGELVGHVVDRSDEIADPRRYEAGGEFRMHVDPIDVVGLMCLRQAKQGGDSRIVSALAVHNALLHERPDLLDALYNGYRLFRPYPDRGDAPALTAHKVPFFAADEDGDFASFFLPDPARQAVAREGVKLSPREREALDLAEAVATRPDLVLNMQLIPGDVQFLNNRRILHSRAAYEDYPEKERRRLMLRIWLMMPGWASLAPAQQFFDDAHKCGGGIVPQRGL